MIRKAQMKKQAKLVMLEVKRGRELLEEMKTKTCGSAIVSKAMCDFIENAEKRYSEIEARVLAM